MPKRCCVKDCRNVEIPGCNTSFYRFPKDPAVCRLWLSRCNRRNIDVTQDRICDEHFEDNEFEELKIFKATRRGRLKLNAVPSLNVHLPKGNYAPVPAQEEQNLKVSGELCIVAACKNASNPVDKNTHFFHFPKDPDRRKQWIRRCNNPSKFNADKSFICDFHFSAEDFKVTQWRSRKYEETRKPRLKGTEMALSSALEEYESFVTLVVRQLDVCNELLSSGDHTVAAISLDKVEILGDRLFRIISNTTGDELLDQLFRVAQYLIETINEASRLNCVPNQMVHKLRRTCQRTTSSLQRGRPAFIISEEDILTCRNAGMTLKSTAHFLGVSRSTLHRNMWKVTPNPRISSEELLRLIHHLKSENGQIGEKYIVAHIKAAGWSVTRARVRKSLRIVAPVRTIFGQRLKTKRRKYSVNGPNYLWHIDANEKLQPFHLYIHACVDGFSRKLLYLHCSNNKKAATPLNLFISTVQQYGFPKMCRSDKGRENIEVAKFVIKHRYPLFRRPYIVGKSVHNVRVERLWVEVNKVTLSYKNLFRSLQACNVIDLDNKLHMYALAFVCIPLIQKSLDQFVVQWNGHKIRTANNKTPNELYLTGNKAEVPLVSCNSSEAEGFYEDFIKMPLSNFNVFQQLAKELIPDPQTNSPLHNLTLLIRDVEAMSQV